MNKGADTSVRAPSFQIDRTPLHASESNGSDQAISGLSDSETDLGESSPAGRRRWLQEVVSSKTFECFFMSIIFLNVVSMVIQADIHYVRLPSCGDETRNDKTCNLWFWINPIFLWLFTVEVVLRITAFGCRNYFWTSPDLFWNLFDFAVVATGLLDIVLRMLRLGRKGGKAIAIARTLRILRVLRIVRLLRAFRQLRMLARGLLESVTVVGWILFLVALLIFLYAIFITDFVNDTENLDNEEEIRGYWGSIFLSMFTLFQIVTLDNWVDVYDATVPHMPGFFKLVLLSFVTIESFVILSLLTGVMADHMDKVRKDEERDLHTVNRKGVDDTQAVFKRRFEKEDGEAYMTSQDFAQVFTDRKLALELFVDDIDIPGHEAQEAHDIFAVIDRNCDGKLFWEEFSDGLKDFREGLTSPAILRMQGLCCKLEQQVQRTPAGAPLAAGGERAPQPSETSSEQLETLEANMQQLDNRCAMFENNVQELIRLYKEQMPSLLPNL